MRPVGLKKMSTLLSVIGVGAQAVEYFNSTQPL